MKPAEKQKVKEEALKKQQERPEEKPLPELKFTEQEKDEFVKNLSEGVPFCKKFSFGKGDNKFSITLRDKTKEEGEVIGRALDFAMDKKKILNWTEYAHYYNVCSLYYQVKEINGVEHITEVPKSPFDEFDLLGKVSESPISSWTNAQMYLAMGFMTQFNQAVLKLLQEAFEDPNFS